MRRNALVCAAALALAGCISENPGDAIHNNTEAIAAAKKICGRVPVRNGELWHAVLRRGWWHVYLNGEYANDEKTAAVTIEIRASDGRSYGCKP
jgi:hypothetical protein